MPLKVTIELAGYYGVDKKISEFYVGRDEDLKSRTSGEHKYSVSTQVWPWEPVVEFDHEYSDGAETCVRRALEAMEKKGITHGKE